MKLVARDPAGVARTMVQLTPTAKPKHYTKPLRLSAAQVRALRFAGQDRFGNVERARRAKLPQRS